MYSVHALTLTVPQNYRFLDLLHVLCVCDDVAIPNNQSYIVQRWLQCEQVGALIARVSSCHGHVTVTS